MNILDKIVKDKKREVASSKKALPLAVVKRKAPLVVFSKKLLKAKELQLIAEIKPKSPSAGIIRKTADPSKLAKLFEARGAAAISVLTDNKYFGGNLSNLLKAKSSCRLPILRKDFIIDEYQLHESKAYGADIVLLIVSVLKNKLKSFVKLALKLNLQPLIEVHDSGELKSVLKSIKPSEQIIIGVNNRNLKTFKVSLDTSLKLVKLIPKKFIKISESGIVNANQLKELTSAGFDGVLIGAGLVKNPKLFNYFV